MSLPQARAGIQYAALRAQASTDGLLTRAGTTGLFIANLAADGSHLWSKRLGNVSIQVGIGAARQRR